VTPIVVSNELYGDTFGVLRRIWATGALVDMVYTPPIGTVLDLHFIQELQGSPVAMVARARVLLIEERRVVFEFLGWT
jgi:hypothetical protein